MTGALLAAPAAPLDAAGQPVLGSFRGAFTHVDYDRIATRVTRTVREKRWLWTMLVKEPWVVALAVVRTGYAASAFGFVQRIGEPGFTADESRMGPASRAWVERRDGATLARFGSDQEPIIRVEGSPKANRAHETEGSPKANRAHETEGSPKANEAAWTTTARLGSFEVDAECTYSADPLAVVARVPGGVVNATEKNVGHCNRGQLRLGSTTIDLSGALVGYDFTHGLLARRTAWRWAFGLARDAAGAPIGFNLTSGFVGGAECATFGPSGPALIAEPTFELDPSRYETPWRIGGPGVDLRAELGGLHTEKKRLVLVRSDFLQAAATFRGSLGAIADARWLGVVEDQDVTW